MEWLQDGYAYALSTSAWWLSLVTGILGVNELTEYLFQKSIKPIHRHKWRTVFALLVLAQACVYFDLNADHKGVLAEKNQLHGHVLKLEKRIDDLNKQAARYVPEPVSFPLGGSPNGFREGPVNQADTEWLPVVGHQDVELDWTKFQNAEATAEITIWVKNRPNAGGFAGQARIWNLTDGVAVASTRRMSVEETPIRISLGIPSERAKKAYRLQVKPDPYAMVTASGELVVKPR